MKANRYAILRNLSLITALYTVVSDGALPVMV